MGPIRTVLFDLDGTLADTAPDLGYALNVLLVEEGRAELPFAVLRPVASHGARALIQLGFGIAPEAPEFAALRRRFLAIYQRNLVRHTRLFPGMAELLAELRRRHLNWGIVTNKPAFLTEPLVQGLGLDDAACIVSGDTAPHAKPHPAPMLHACALSGSLPEECLYVGDAERDVQAGRAAGMKTLVALFGYIAADEHPAHWGADALVATPHDILAHLA